MKWHQLRLIRVWSATLLLTGGVLSTLALAEPSEPVPATDLEAKTVSILQARDTGELDVKVRGGGAEQVKVSLQNTTGRRLNVVLPPGLVAAGATGQDPFQSMGLGPRASTEGGFGRAQAHAPEGAFRSIPATRTGSELDADAMVIPAGQSVEFTLPAVCLNYGRPTPTPRDVFTLMDVDDYSSDPRIGKALRSLATLGTSHGVAQAAMWNVCNDVPFPRMVSQFSRIVNRHEAALAARFVEDLDSSTSADSVDPASLREGRVFARVRAEGELASEAARLNEELAGLNILGLPVRTIDGNEAPTSSGPAVLLTITLSAGRPGETRGHVAALYREGTVWPVLGQATFTEGSSAEILDGESLARAIDRAVAPAFVSVKAARRGIGNTTLKVENRLPFTLGAVVLKAGDSAGAPSVQLDGLGIGPAREGLAPIQAAGATVERVVLNGL